MRFPSRSPSNPRRRTGEIFLVIHRGHMRALAPPGVSGSPRMSTGRRLRARAREAGGPVLDLGPLPWADLLAASDGETASVSEIVADFLSLGLVQSRKTKETSITSESATLQQFSMVQNR